MTFRFHRVKSNFVEKMFPVLSLWIHYLIRGIAAEKFVELILTFRPSNNIHKYFSWTKS